MMKKELKGKSEEVWLNLGCGVHLTEGFINVDNFFDRKDLEGKKGIYRDATIDEGAEFVRADICDLPFKDNYADYIETLDTVEHIGFFQIEKAFKEMYRVLKPGGKLGLMTTNFDQLAALWTLNIAGKSWDDSTFARFVSLSKVVYGNQAGPGEFHKIPFNPPFLMYLLMQAGWKVENVKISIHPMNTKEFPPVKSYGWGGWGDSNVLLTDMMWAECIKI